MSLSNIRCPKCKNKIQYPYDKCKECKWIPTKTQKKFQQIVKKRYENKYKKQLLFKEKRIYYTNITDFDWKKFRLSKNFPLFFFLSLGAAILSFTTMPIWIIGNEHDFTINNYLLRSIGASTLLLFLILSASTLLLYRDIRNDIKSFNKRGYKVYIKGRYLVIKDKLIRNNIPINMIKSIEPSDIKLNYYHMVFNRDKFPAGFMQLPIIKGDNMLKVTLKEDIEITNFIPRELTTNILYVDVNRKLWKSFIEDLIEVKSSIKVKELDYGLDAKLFVNRNILHKSYVDCEMRF